MKQDELVYDASEVRERGVSEPAYSEDGVDLTLIRWMLSLTPLERLQALQQFANSILRLRNARSST